jgi:hypothetical protein
MTKANRDAIAAIEGGALAEHVTAAMHEDFRGLQRRRRVAPQ